MPVFPGLGQLGHVFFQGFAFLFVERFLIPHGSDVNPQMIKRTHADHDTRNREPQRA